jgi:hypothetical protein
MRIAIAVVVSTLLSVVPLVALQPAGANEDVAQETTAQTLPDVAVPTSVLSDGVAVGVGVIAVPDDPQPLGERVE